MNSLGSQQNLVTESLDEDLKSKNESTGKVLKYGQIIQLYGTFDRRIGLLYSKGWAEKAVNVIEAHDLESVPNMRDSFFRILPKGQFYIHDEYQKTSADEKNLLGDRLKRELKNYENLIKQSLGNTIDLGSEIILEHLNSYNEYLYGTQECLKNQSDSYKLKVRRHLESSNLFKITSANSFDLDGDLIPFGQELFLQHVKTGYFLDIYKQNQIDFDYHLKNVPQEIDEFNPIKTPAPSDCRFQCILSSHKDTIWNFHLIFSSDYQEDEKIYNQDIVQIIHNSSNSILAQNEQNNKLILKEQIQSAPAPIYDSFFQISVTNENENLFHLRHFISGKMVTFQKIRIDKNENYCSHFENQSDDFIKEEDQHHHKNQNPTSSHLRSQTNHLSNFNNKLASSSSSQTFSRIGRMESQSRNNSRKIQYQILISSSQDEKKKISEQIEPKSPKQNHRYSLKKVSQQIVQRTKSLVNKVTNKQDSHLKKLKNKDSHSLWEMTLMMKEKYQPSLMISSNPYLMTSPPVTQYSGNSISSFVTDQTNNKINLSHHHHKTAPSLCSNKLNTQESLPRSLMKTQENVQEEEQSYLEGSLKIEYNQLLQNDVSEPQNLQKSDRKQMSFKDAAADYGSFIEHNVEPNFTEDNHVIDIKLEKYVKDHPYQQIHIQQIVRKIKDQGILDKADNTIKNETVEVQESFPILKSSPCFVKLTEGKLELVEQDQQSKIPINGAQIIPFTPFTPFTPLTPGHIQDKKQNANSKILQKAQDYYETIPSFRKSKATLKFDTNIDEMIMRQQRCEQTLHSRKDCQYMNKKSRSGFRIVKISKKVHHLLLWALSAQEQLNYFCNLINMFEYSTEMLRSELTLKRIKSTIKCVSYINTRLERGGVGNESSAFEDTITTQNILIDTKVSFQIVQILYSLYYSEDVLSIFNDNEVISSQLRTLIRICYILLKNIVKGNQKAKLIVSQYLELFIKHAFNMTDEISIQVFLSELFYDNYRSISDLITPDSIKNIILQIYKSDLPHPIHCKILSAVTQCNNTAIAENQNCVIEQFFSIKKVHPLFHFYFKYLENSKIGSQFNDLLQSQNDLFIRIQLILEDNPKLMTIEQLFKLSIKQDDNQRVFKYFISYFDLLANICFSHNKNGKYLVESIISIDQILYLLNNYSNILVGSSKTPFLKLLQHGFIDITDTYIIPKILKVREWNQIDLLGGINKSGNQRHLEEIQQILDYILEFFINHTSLSSTEDSINLEILTMLEIFKSTTDLGIQCNQSRVNQFVPILISILKSEVLFSGQVEGKKLPQKLQVNFTIIQKCKQLITSILNEYLDIEVNIQLSIVLRQFKQYVDQNKEYFLGNQDSEDIINQWIKFFSVCQNNLPSVCSQKSIQDRMINQSFINIDEQIEFEPLQQIKGMDDIDFTIMVQLVQKDNKSILDSLLHLLMRSFSTKKELFVNLQKIILVKGGLPEKITKNIQRYRLSIEKLKDLQFLTDLNKPIIKNASGQNSPINKGQIVIKKAMSNFQRKNERNDSPQDTPKDSNCSSESLNDSNNDITSHQNLQNKKSINLEEEVTLNLTKTQFVRPSSTNLEDILLKKKQGNITQEKIAKLFRQFIRQNKLKPSSKEDITLNTNEKTKQVAPVQAAKKVELQKVPSIPNLSQKSENSNQFKFSDKKGWSDICVRSFNYLEFLLADLSQLTSFMKEGFEQKGENIEIQEVLARESKYFIFSKHEQKIKSFLHERELNNKLIQNLIRSHDLHPTIFKFIGTINSKNLNIKIENLLISIYEFLTVLVWNNHEAKMDFVRGKSIALSHVAFNCGALEFLKELYTNVKMLILNQSEMKNISSSILKIANDQSTNILFKSKLIFFLRNLVVLNDKPVKVNQGLIFEAIQSKDYSNINLLSTDQSQNSILSELSELVKQFSSQLESCLENKIKFLEINPQIAYLISLFSLLQHLSEDNNHLELRKKRKLHSFKFLVQLLKQSGTHLLLKKEIRGFINRIYYLPKENEDNYQNFKFKQNKHEEQTKQNVFKPSTNQNFSSPQKISPKSESPFSELKSQNLRSPQKIPPKNDSPFEDLFSQIDEEKKSQPQQLEQNDCRKTNDTSTESDNLTSISLVKKNSIITLNPYEKSESQSTNSENQQIKGPQQIELKTTHQNPQIDKKIVQNQIKITSRKNEVENEYSNESFQNNLQTLLAQKTSEDGSEIIEEILEEEEEELDQLYQSDQEQQYLEKRQQGLEAKKEKFKKEVEQSYFKEYGVIENNSLKIEKKNIFQQNEMIYDVIEDLFYISKDLKEHLLLIQKDKIVEEIEIQDYIRFKYFKSYVLLNFNEILTSLYYLFTNEDFLSILNSHLEFVLKQGIHKYNPYLLIAEIVNSLISIGKLSNYMNQPLKQIVKKLYSIIKKIDLKYTSLKEQDHKILNKLIAPIQLIDEADIYSPLVDDDKNQVKNLRLNLGGGKEREKFDENDDENESLFQVDNQKQNVLKKIKQFVKFYGSMSKSEDKINKSFLISTQIKQKDKNEKLNNQMKYELYLLDNSSTFNSLLKSENDKLLQTTWSPDHKICDSGVSELSKKHFIQSILDTALSSQNLKDELHIFYLNILIQFIKKENNIADVIQIIQSSLYVIFKQTDQIEEIDVWETSFWKNSKDEIEAMQNMIYNFGGAMLVCMLLKKPNLEQRLGLVSHILLFGISLLLGGHRKTQNRILQILREDTDNILLHNLQTLINKIGNIIYRFSKEKVKVQEQVLVTIDTYDYYSKSKQEMIRKNTMNQDDYKEEQFKKLCIEVLKRVFRFLQLCCEDNNVEMKNFLRQQTNIDRRFKPNSINFIQIAAEQNRDFLTISSTVIFFSSIQSYYFDCDQTILEIPNFITDFMIEVTQVPCLQNQISLCQTSFFEDVSLLSQMLSKNSQTEQVDKEQEEDLMKFYSKVMQSALVVLEGTDQQIYAEVMSKISMEFMWIVVKKHFQKMQVSNEEELKSYIDNNEIEGYFDHDVMEILQVLTVIRRCGEYDTDFTERFFSSANEEERKMLLYLDSCIAVIEIYDQKHCKPVYFPFAPLYGCLSQATRNKIMNEVNRETQRDKIIDLLEYQDLVFDEMLHNYQLSKNSIPATGSNVELIQTIITYLSLFINLFLGFSTTVEIIKEEGQQLSYSFENASYHISNLTFIFFVLVVVFIVFKAINQVPLKSDNLQPPSLFIKVRHLLSIDEIPSLLLLLFSAILSIFIHPKFIVISLPYSFSKLKLVQGTLETLYQAMFMKMKQLLLVSFLGVLFLYIFSVLAFQSYYGEVYQDTDYNENQTCTSLISCMITLSLSGVVGDGMTHWELSTFLYDTLYFIFVSILFSNIISGIMTDTFAEMRDKRNFIEADKKNNCFMCGIERTILEKQEQTFENHIKKHCLWEYLFYIYSLKIKEETEYTGIEYMITDKLDKQDISWIPNNSHLND